MFRLRLPSKPRLILFSLAAILAMTLAAPNSESIDTLVDGENRLGEDGPEQPQPDLPSTAAGLDLPQLWRLLGKIERRQEEFDGEITGLAAALNGNLEMARQEWARAAAKRQIDIEQNDRSLRKLRQDVEGDSEKMSRLSRRLGEVQSTANESLAKVTTLETGLRAVDGNTAALRTQQNQVTTSLNALTRLVQETRSGLTARISRLENGQGRPLPLQPLPPYRITTTTPTPDRSCGGTFSASSGQIRYPGTLGNYLPNRDCTWTITAPTDKHVVIRFQRFSLEGGSECGLDWLEIRDGNGARQHRFCDQEIPLGGHPISVPRTMTIVFQSDGTVGFTGFLLTWEFADQAPPPAPSTACGGSLGAEGTLKYPLFGNYLSNQHCNWTLNAPEGKLIRMHFTRIRMQSGTGCPTDWIKLQTEGNTLAKYCTPNFQGTSVPFISLNTTLNVVFHSDGSGVAAGFELQWRSIERDSVNRMYFYNADWAHALVQPGPNARSSPGGGDPRRQGLAMVYEYPNSTAVSRVTVEASRTVCAGVVGPTCKYENTVTFESETNRSWVMKSDGVHAQKSGSMDLSEVDPEGPVYPWTLAPFCGGSFNTSSGTIRHPLAGESLYGDNEDCTWTINAPVGQHINLRFQRFELENDDTCSYDFLEIRDGGRFLGKFCGYSLPRGGFLESTGSQLSLRFRTDGSGQRRGFELSWTAGGVLVASTTNSVTEDSVAVDNATVASPTDDSVPVETVVEDSVPVETVAEDSVPVETVAEDSVPVETVAHDSVPVETVAENSVPVETFSEDYVPMETVAEDSVPVETVAEDSVPVETVAEDSVPVETVTLEKSKVREDHLNM